RNIDVLCSQVNRACAILRNICENILKNKREKKIAKATEEEESGPLNLFEKDELINGLKDLYHASDKSEQVRLLTIAPANWGRQKVQKFFDNPERQARRSRELRSTKGVLTNHWMLLSKFFDLKPRHVQPIFLHDTCCCVYYENFDLVLKAWNRISNQQIDRRKLIDDILCSPITELCYSRDCDEITEWTSWKRTNNRVALQKINGSVSLLLDYIDEQWENFLSHHYFTIMQQSYIAEIKKRSDPHDVVIVQMDFAQNFALISQHEVQSAHFDKPQATVLTIFVVLGSEHKSFVIISDYLEHDTKFVYFAQQLVVSTVKQIAPRVRLINYVTDGAPSHFKNRHNILNLSFHEIDFGVRSIWTFTATSHGKGPVDGLGAAVKSTATRYLMRHGPE
ncbi:unnamed protein product, partial [Rotaria socialis]